MRVSTHLYRYVGKYFCFFQIKSSAAVNDNIDNTLTLNNLMMMFDNRSSPQTITVEHSKLRLHFITLILSICLLVNFENRIRKLLIESFSVFSNIITTTNNNDCNNLYYNRCDLLSSAYFEPLHNSRRIIFVGIIRATCRGIGAAA